MDVLNTSSIMFAVIGDPIKHSMSPIMMNHAFNISGFNGVYTSSLVKSDQLGAAIEGIRALGFGGVNVTIPHKVDVMSYCDDIHEDARAIGAVNTIVNDNGKLIGYNTDGIGYVRSLMEETGTDIKDKVIVMVGAGGAARGVVYALSLQQPKEIVIANRTLAKAEQLADGIHDVPTRAISLDSVSHDIINEADIIINNTSVGMYPHIDETPINLHEIVKPVIVSDLIYNPLETKWLREAKAKGCVTHSGLGMFIYQGAYAFEYWTKKQAPVEEMRKVVYESLQNRSKE
ncbi:shikimate dehydrogenase [Longirhabdus pacifica]|uniref:shikimate dehydrogenase n=1 Tax=Longirhabdus pacifica TaxID=2305227 RepID=UPI0010088F1D|nr:shikimate dehydrogenase [Longirhabdus pacifica]